jgi:transposase-like protein
MSPQLLFCLNLDCPSRGRIDADNIRVHNSLEGRFRCHTCGRTFASTKGTIFYRLKTDPKIVILVLTLLAYGCPLQAIVRAFEFDERTVTNWQKKAGEHCKQTHRHLVEQQARDLGQVQADEIRAKLQKRLVLWMAMALQVSTRLWLGGVVSPSRDKVLIRRLVHMVRCQALERPILLMTDGLVTYVKAWKRAFCNIVKSGKRGHPRHIPWPHVVIGQVVKRYEKKRVVGVDHRLVQGTKQLFEALNVMGQKMNTAYIERINATFRQRLCGLVRRGRCLLRREAVLEGGMYLIGCVYNFCTPHESLRVQNAAGACWAQRTPAMAAGITDDIWSISDLFWYRIAPPPYIPTKPKSNRGRPLGSKNKPKVAVEATK